MYEAFGAVGGMHALIEKHPRMTPTVDVGDEVPVSFANHAECRNGDAG